MNTLRYEELIMELVGHQGHVSRVDVVELLHVTPSQAFRLLQKLVKAERLALTGKGAGAKYIPKGSVLSITKNARARLQTRACVFDVVYVCYAS